MDPIYVEAIDERLELSGLNHPSQPVSRQPLPDAAAGSPLAGRDPFISSHRRNTECRSLKTRLVELESENMRLHRLVAELLIKNQQLRRAGESSG
jgi:hypothetical protein